MITDEGHTHEMAAKAKRSPLARKRRKKNQRRPARLTPTTDWSTWLRLATGKNKKKKNGKGMRNAANQPRKKKGIRHEPDDAVRVTASTNGAVGNDYANQSAALAANPVPGNAEMDPLQQAIAGVNQARLDTRFRKFLPVRQKRLDFLTQERLPDSHQAGDALDIPVLTKAEAYNIHNDRRMRRSAVPAEEGESLPPVDAGSMRFGGAPPGQPARDTGYGHMPPRQAGEPIIAHEKPLPRDDPHFAAFVERAVQNEPDDVFREVAFRIIDSCELDVADPGHNSTMMTLVNKKKNSSLQMTVTEFKDAVAFICDPKKPLITDLPGDGGKTIALLQLMNPRPRGMVMGYLSNAAPDVDLGALRDPASVFRAKLKLQEKLNYVREKLTPVTSMPAVRSWLETLTLGFFGKPEPGSAASIQTVASAVPKNRQRECADLLNAMTDNGLISWDAKGVLRDPRRHVYMPNTNIFNIVHNLYTLGSPATTEHISRYEPTGLTFFVDRIMALAEEEGKIPQEALRAVKKARRGNTRWTERECNGRRYNLVTMFSYFVQYLPAISAVAGGIHTFLPIILTISPIDWAWFAWLMDWMASLGTGDAVTAWIIRTFGPYVEWTISRLPNGLQGPATGAAQGALAYYQRSIPGAAYALGVTFFMTLAGAIATFARRMYA